MRISDWSSDVCSSDLNFVRFSPRNRLYTKYVHLNPWDFENSDRAFSGIDENDRYSFILFLTILFPKNNSYVYKEFGALMNDIVHNKNDPARYISKFYPVNISNCIKSLLRLRCNFTKLTISDAPHQLLNKSQLITLRI